MSASGITTVALLVPALASSTIFSARRLSKGVDNLEEQPLYSIASFDIAAGQILKGARAAKAISISLNDSAVLDGTSGNIKNTADTIKTSNKFLKGAGKVINFTADHINPLIVGAGCLKVLGSDDKLDTAARESTSLVCMFAAEKAAKEFIGMPDIKLSKNNTSVNSKDGLYKKLFSQSQLKAIEDFCATKKYMKSAVGGAKGLLFVGASIGGYTLGEKITDKILGEKDAKKAEINSTSEV